ncbi:MAG: hypothetical protein D6704_12075 [Nitrospirae bacterium]|nr:MAG: hypothetical protein D6704_12075 [Nitrospirota bacterium]
MAMLEGLALTAKATGFVLVEETLNEVSQQVREGQPLAEPLRQTGLFPSLVPDMVALGEATGRLDMMFEKIADLYEEESQTTLRSLTALVEPLIIVVLGLGIGFIVVAMYLPIFSIASIVS